MHIEFPRRAAGRGIPISAAPLGLLKEDSHRWPEDHLEEPTLADLQSQESIFLPLLLCSSGMPQPAGGMLCNHPFHKKKNQKKTPGNAKSVASGGGGRMRRAAARTCCRGSGIVRTDVPGAAAPCAARSARCSHCSAAPHSAAPRPLPHCSSRKLALKTHPKPPRPSTAGDCYWPQLPPLCLITSIWGCGKM